MDQTCNTTIGRKDGSFLSNNITLQTKQISSHIIEASVKINSTLITPIRYQTLLIFKKVASAAGLNDIPISYLEQNYKSEINNYLTNFIYNYFVIDFLLEELSNKKIFLSNSPRLKNIRIISQDEIIFTFDISTADSIAIREWKNFVFKSPKRKNYKDLDKQVDLFIKKIHDESKKCNLDSIEVGDWVCFNAQILSEDDTQFLDHSSIFWIHIVPHPIRNTFIELFISKKLNDTFIVSNLSFRDEEDFDLPNSLKFNINIVAITKGSQTSIDILKSVFKISNKDGLHDKLIEVFSYRNDQTQRQAIIEEMFHLLLSKHRFEIPKHLVLRKQEEILRYLQKRPDFEAYRSQNDFFTQVTTLAEKQLKEEIITDQIAHTEKIKVEIKDIQNYLSLFCNPRLKEFIYFKSLFDYGNDFSFPIHHATLKQLCKREKTLNHILFHLTR